MLTQSVYIRPDGSRVLWDDEEQCYLVRNKEPKDVNTSNGLCPAGLCNGGFACNHK